MKRHTAKSIVVLMSLLIILGSGTTALAAQPSAIEPMYIGLLRADPLVTISSGTVFCKDLVTIKTGYSANITWTLQGGPGREFKAIATWTSSGGTRHPLDASRIADKGSSYRLKTSIKVYNSSGTLVDDEVKYSRVVTY